jgi:glycosyltransferase involved in cell wall biosynthesis
LGSTGPGKRRRRPRLAYLSWRVRNHSVPLLARASEDYEVVAISLTFPDELRGVVSWERLRFASKPSRSRWPLVAASAGAALRRCRADLVHEHSPLPLTRRVDLATVLFSWTGLYDALDRRGEGHRPLESAAATGWRRLEQWSYSPKRTSMLAALCRTHREELRRLFPGVPVEVTPRGTDIERFRPGSSDRRAVRAELGIPEDEVVVAFMARAERYKGLPLLIEALAEIRESGRQPPLVLAITPRASWARRQARELSVEDRVLWPGWEVDVPRYLRCADLFALPTRYETYCQAAHEAAATGLPVVGTRVYGMRELIGDDEAGLLVERSAGSIADAIIRLEDPALRARLGAEGRRRCEAETTDGFVESTLELYERLLARRGARSSSPGRS